MVSLLISGGVAMIVALVGSPLLVRSLRGRGLGQPVRDYLPARDQVKAGRPNMGGIAITAGAVLGYAAGHLRTASAGHVRITAVFTAPGLTVLFAIVGEGAVGLLDDWTKARRGVGLNKRAKSAGQLAVAIVFAVLARNWVHVASTISFIRLGDTRFHLPGLIWMAFATVVVYGSCNATNFTDGLDGLVAGSSAFGFAALVIIGFWEFRHVAFYHVVHAAFPLDLALIAAGMAGGCAGFLWWNAAPAQIIMGDVGSNAIGAGLAGFCLLSSTDLLLPVIAGLFVFEALSVITQIFTFHVFHRRVFRMAPIHYHFELGGWPDTTVMVRFWIIAAMCTALALGLFYYDFISLGGLD